jgi:uncharacterized membrane protein
MSSPPNELYTAFSLVGFVLCAIPFYWHFKGMWIYPTRFEYLILRIYGPSLEHGHLFVYVLGRSRMPVTRHQFDRMEQEHYQQGSNIL